MHLSAAQLSPADRYKLLIGCIVPRPIAFVSTIAPDGSSTNLAPFSFFNGIGGNPMTLLFCPANRDDDGGDKDSLRNARPISEGGTGEFVVNAAVDSYIAEVALAAEPLPYGESEFTLTGLTPAPSIAIRPPRVAESPWAFECRTMKLVRLAPGVPGGPNVVIGEVIHIHLRDDLVDARWRVDPARLNAVGRMGGFGYARTTDRFERRPGLGGRE